MSVSFRLIVLVLCSLRGTLSLFAQDAANSQDHPLLTRYPGAEIHWYEEQAFEQYEIALGPLSGYRHIENWRQVAGKLSRIFYSIEGKRSVSEVYLNYQTALRKGGFEVLVEGLFKSSNVAKQVGGRTWLNTAYSKNPLPPNGKLTLFHGTATSGGTAFIAGELKRPQGNVYVAIAFYQHREDEVVVMLDVIESQAVEDELVWADPEAMSGELDREGKVLIYGLYFEFDKAVLAAESTPVLDAIAALLRQRSELHLYVVGHTDMKGSLAYNLTLSQSRAQAVVDALVQDYQISRSRLQAQGVGPLVPVSSNQNDQGRSLNRRVELVQK
ncbi:MAG: OmpA family protein [Bacteroidota bacterium]